MFMKHKHRKSIITYTVFRISAVFFPIMVLMLLIVGNIFVSSMKKNITENRTDLIDNTGKSIENIFEGLKVPMVSMADFAPAKRILEEDDTLYSKEWLDNIRSIDEYLYNVNTFQDYIVDIALIQTDSTLQYSLTDQFRADYPYIEQEWFQKALEQDGLIKYAEPEDADHLNTDIPYSITAIYPVTRNETLRGYILMEISLKNVSRLFEKTDAKDSHGGIMLLGNQGRFIFDYNGNRDKVPAEIEKAATSLKEDQVMSFTADGEFYIVKKLVEPQWCIVSEDSYSILAKPIYDSLKVMAITLGVGILLIILVTVFVSKSMQKPYGRLIERIASYDGSGPIEIYEDKKTPWEIMAVRTKFEDMAGHINSLIEDVYVEKLRKQEMELQILTNQINPHFLYNSLQVIQTKAVLCDNQDIEEMILALGNMLRYSMERTKEKVTIREEISYIKDYLMFYKVRFPRLFDYSIECPEKIMGYKTIKFILQPIVENCFKHGFKDKKEGGRVTVIVEEHLSEICFTIVDNGNGIEGPQLKDLIQQLKKREVSQHIGVANTNMRIQLAYGPGYGVEIDSRKGEYTKVILNISKEGEGNV